MIEIPNLSLNTPVFHYYYGEGKILEIEKTNIVVEFNCMFLNNKFDLVFVTNTNTSSYTTDNKRHISELSLMEFSK